MNHVRRSILTTLFAVFLAGSTSAAADFYQGTWKIASAAIAPWWRDAKAPDDAESKALVGKTFAIRARDITGPRQVACRDPRFEVKPYTADLLFQGGLDGLPNQAKALAALGFQGKQWKTLITGCANELEFHFIDDNTVAFALNNYIYTLRKQ